MGIRSPNLQDGQMITSLRKQQMFTAKNTIFTKCQSSHHHGCFYPQLCTCMSFDDARKSTRTGARAVRILHVRKCMNMAGNFMLLRHVKAKTRLNILNP